MALALLAGGGILGASAYFTQQVLPDSIQASKFQYREEKKKGINLASTRSQYAIWHPDTNSGMEIPKQDVKTVPEVQEAYAGDVVNFQNEQLRFNLRKRMGRRPLECAGYTPLLTNTLNATKVLTVNNGDLSDNPMCKNIRMIADENPVYMDYAVTSGASEENTYIMRPELIRSFISAKRNPFGPSGQFTNLHIGDMHPSTQTGQLPRQMVFTGRNNQQITIKSKSIKRQA